MSDDEAMRARRTELPRHHTPPPADRGSALVIAMLGTALLGALGVGLITMTNTERTIAANYRKGSELIYAADAGVERVVQDLQLAPDWSLVLSGAARSAFVDNSLTPATPTGQALNLTSMTTTMQAQADGVNRWGANNPRWRLFAYGPLAAMAAPGAIHSDAYVVVWMGDDPSETDNNPDADTNGVVAVIAQAIGANGSIRTVEATVAGGPAGSNNGAAQGVRILSWREIR
jgi:hypothetical protein